MYTFGNNPHKSFTPKILKHTACGCSLFKRMVSTEMKNLWKSSVQTKKACQKVNQLWEKNNWYLWHKNKKRNIKNRNTSVTYPEKKSMICSMKIIVIAGFTIIVFQKKFLGSWKYIYMAFSVPTQNSKNISHNNNNNNNNNSNNNNNDHNNNNNNNK